MTDFAQPQPFISSRVRRMKRRAFMRKIYPILLFIAILLIIAFLFNHKGEIVSSVSNVKVEAVHAQETASSSATPVIIVEEDKRIATLEEFLTKKDSPLAPYSKFFIETADKYGLDWTLMPAISGMESNFGKSMPSKSNNPFGLGGGKLMKFTALYDSIEFEAKLLSEKYKLASNRAIGSIYCPSFECNQNWAVIVTNFSEEILN
jgi:hypothetical protein